MNLHKKTNISVADCIPLRQTDAIRDRKMFIRESREPPSFQPGKFPDFFAE